MRSNVTTLAAILLFAIIAVSGLQHLSTSVPSDQMPRNRTLVALVSSQQEADADSPEVDQRPKEWMAARENAKNPIDAKNLEALERVIKVEPKYEGDERHYYCLIFDDDQSQMMWMVFDGSMLYVDCNFNGDLTEDGEAFEPEENKRRSSSRVEKFSFKTPRGQDVSLEFTFPGFVMQGSDPDKYPVRIKVNYRGGTFAAWGDQTGEVANAKTASEAPILRVNGPLQMGFEVSARSAVRRTEDDEFKIKAGVGTYGLGQGSFMHLKYWHEAIPSDRFPQAELEFPAGDKSKPNVVAKLKLKERC